jgi:hypothetical protein
MKNGVPGLEHTTSIVKTKIPTTNFGTIHNRIARATHPEARQ